MSNYNKSTNFAVKDTLTSGDPEKVVSGAEIDNEFNSIASAVTSKADKVPAATTDNFAALDANGNLKDSGDTSSSFVPTGFGVPTGSLTAFAATTAPPGWVECDGRAINRSVNSDLFNVIGTTFGNGDGSTTFNVPDLRGEFVRGWDDGRGVDSGRSFGSAQLDQMQRITGRISNRTAFVGDNVTENRGMVTGSENSSSRHTGGSTNSGGTFYFLDSANSPDARVSDTTDGETRPRNVALMYIIKT